MRWFWRCRRAVAIALLPSCIYFVPREWIFSEEHPLCLIRNITGHECPGCGMTRALTSLCYFDFADAWSYNRGVIIVAPLLAYVWMKRIVRTAKNAK